MIAGTKGARSFFIWHETPVDPTLRYEVEAPGLTLVPSDDGSIALVDATGVTVAAIPRPYAVDSTPDERTGSGRFTDRLTLALGKAGRTVTVVVDPDVAGWQKGTAVYPVYVDPSTGWRHGDVVDTLNRAGSRRAETSTISGDPKNGTAAFAYDVPRVPLRGEPGATRSPSSSGPSAAGTPRLWAPSPPRTRSPAIPPIPPAATSTPTAPATRSTGRIRMVGTGTAFLDRQPLPLLPGMSCSAQCDGP